MVNLVDAARPILAARDAIGDAGDTAADAIASDADVDAGPSARLGGTILGADDFGEVSAGLDQTASSVPGAAGDAVTDAVDAVPDWAGPAVFAAIAAVIVAAFSYALGQLFTFEFGS